MTEKLIRDHIPKLAADNGDHITVRTATPAEFPALLRAKLAEETAEAIAAGPDGVLGELADVLEVVRALAAVYGHGPADVERARAVKAVVRGGFGGRLVMQIPADLGEPVNDHTTPDDDEEAEKLAKARRMAKALSAPPVAPAEWASTTEWPGRHKRPGDRRVHATAGFVVFSSRRFWTACGKNVGRDGYPLDRMPVDCRDCQRAMAAEPAAVPGRAADETQPADRAALRDLVARVLRPWMVGGDEADVARRVGHAADAVMAVLPVPSCLPAGIAACMVAAGVDRNSPEKAPDGP